MNVSLEVIAKKYNEYVESQLVLLSNDEIQESDIISWDTFYDNYCDEYYDRVEADRADRVLDDVFVRELL